MAGPDRTREPEPDAMTIHQLAERSGVPARRIRYYVAQGLLPPPVGRGRAAHYRRAHLDRLRQIQVLREANLGLDEIRRRLGAPTVPVREGTPPAVWRRWAVAPGVELHVREDVAPEAARVARALAGVARQLLGDEAHGDGDSDDEVAT
ncbi:helix-turn-helix domain-containing protein [Sphaerobacter sp.]|uniref:helix-turn-helix domain-containing protein n=1 Tax=Sphaerobacter sp. TaxID=2099654 RepID=UPI001D519244|nr:helix-turn-helix domain-containing protein [Sphaerobacter sp.]MBX5445082.1 MerR family transcriptional regulator [Sphaerobacter sp.]